MKNPLTAEHKKLLEDASRKLSEFAMLTTKLEHCGEDCTAARELHQQLTDRVQAYRDQFFGDQAGWDK